MLTCVRCAAVCKLGRMQVTIHSQRCCLSKQSSGQIAVAGTASPRIFAVPVPAGTIGECGVLAQSDTHRSVTAYSKQPTFTYGSLATSAVITLASSNILLHALRPVHEQPSSALLLLNWTAHRAHMHHLCFAAQVPGASGSSAGSCHLLWGQGSRADLPLQIMLTSQRREVPFQH